MPENRHLTDWQCVGLLLGLAGGALLLYFLLVPSPKVIRPQRAEPRKTDSSSQEKKPSAAARTPTRNP
jgi:hypothetical protein